jgi:hypothetical protein
VAAIPNGIFCVVALGTAAVAAGHKVRYFTAAELAETLYRGLADNSVGRIIDTLLRNDLILIDEVGFAPLDDTGAQLLFRVVAAAYERRALGIASHWPSFLGPVPARAHHRRQPARPAPAPRQRRGHRRRLLPHAPSPSQERNHLEQHLTNPRGGDFYLATSGDKNLAVNIGSRTVRILIPWAVLCRVCQLGDAWTGACGLQFLKSGE